MKLSDLKETRYAGGIPDLIDTVQQIIKDAGFELGTGVRDTVAIGMNTPIGARSSREIVLRKRKPDNGFVNHVADELKGRGLEVVNISIRAEPPRSIIIHAVITVRDPSF